MPSLCTLTLLTGAPGSLGTHWEPGLDPAALRVSCPILLWRVCGPGFLPALTSEGPEAQRSCGSRTGPTLGFAAPEPYHGMSRVQAQLGSSSWLSRPAHVSRRRPALLAHGSQLQVSCVLPLSTPSTWGAGALGSPQGQGV